MEFFVEIQNNDVNFYSSFIFSFDKYCKTSNIRCTFVGIIKLSITQM